MDTKRIESDAPSYDGDYYGWTQQQAAHLPSGRMDRVDLENLAEEIESLGKSQESGLSYRYKVLCLHLLKQVVQPQRNGRSWEATIAEQRASIAVHLRKNPGLTCKKADLFADGYEIARKTAKAETGLPLASFPATPPFTIGGRRRDVRAEARLLTSRRGAAATRPGSRHRTLVSGSVASW